jgi:Lrp/AsnC family leucine-responsive transcriptional regulator
LDLDGTDYAIISNLQHDGRMSVAQLARAINLSPSAAADRLRRLTDAGVITGYSITVDPEALGYHVTGSDCFIIKVLARSMRDLERIAGRLATLGGITTNVVYSSPVPSRHITPA